MCAAEEHNDIPLRRSEKATLNALNKSAAAADRDRPGQTFFVRESRETRKVKQRIVEPWEKLFILVRLFIAAFHLGSSSIAATALRHRGGSVSIAQASMRCCEKRDLVFGSPSACSLSGLHGVRLGTREWFQINNCLSSAGDFDKTIEYSMRQDAAKVISNGLRIGQGMIRCAHRPGHG